LGLETRAWNWGKHYRERGIMPSGGSKEEGKRGQARAGFGEGKDLGKRSTGVKSFTPRFKGLKLQSELQFDEKKVKVVCDEIRQT